MNPRRKQGDPGTFRTNDMREGGNDVESVYSPSTMACKRHVLNVQMLKEKRNSLQIDGQPILEWNGSRAPETRSREALV